MAQNIILVFSQPNPRIARGGTFETRFLIGPDLQVQMTLTYLQEKKMLQVQTTVMTYYLTLDFWVSYWKILRENYFLVQVARSF